MTPPRVESGCVEIHPHQLLADLNRFGTFDLVSVLYYYVCVTLRANKLLKSIQGELEPNGARFEALLVNPPKKMSCLSFSSVSELSQNERVGNDSPRMKGKKTHQAHQSSGKQTFEVRKRERSMHAYGRDALSNSSVGPNRKSCSCCSLRPGGDLPPSKPENMISWDFMDLIFSCTVCQKPVLSFPVLILCCDKELEPVSLEFL